VYPFWDLAIQPVLEAVGARRIVEIGALKGDTTIRMLDGLDARAELHVIDPLPAFDPAEHEQRFPGRYIFHRDISLAVLAELPPMDVALIDGDHNWYTVFHELEALSATARTAGRPLPVCILHDVGWPYGRRDLYYAPEQIPEAHRQPYVKGGIVQGQSELSPTGGLNPTNCNADHEGGPRNGVMTALEDFIAGYDRPVRVVVLPVYFGLAIVVEQAVLDAHPALADLLDRLDGAEGQSAIAELAEELRLEGLTGYHNLFYGTVTRLTDAVHLYLDLLKGAVLNEHYIEQELRIHQLVQCLEHGYAPFGESLREPTRRLITQFDELRARRRSGRQSDEEGFGSYFPLTEMGRVRLDRLERALDTIRLEGVPGQFVECGTGRGGGGVFLRGYLRAYDMRWRRVFVADPFRAAPPGMLSTATERGRVTGGGAGFPELLSDVTSVRDAFARFELLDDQVRFLQGPYDACLRDPEIGPVALLRIGDTVGAEAGQILGVLYDSLAPGAVVVVDQYGGNEACRAEVDAFRARRGLVDPIERIDDAAITWRKSEPGAVVASAAPIDEAAAEPPLRLLAPQWTAAVDLTVAVVFFNMKREAARTLHSLSRAYQQGVDDLEYEVLVIDNGSSPDQRLTAEYVRSFGPEFRLVDPGEDVSPSPAVALSRAIRAGRGRAFALMIDGAHVLTPGVLRYGMAGLNTYVPAVVATQQWYVGPGDQGDAVADGYGQKTEDELFGRISWPANGYRLFDIGHFIGERDWLDGMWESNCLFVTREFLEQAGGFDERFDEPGGGYANLDLYERATVAQDINLVTILGEGSFHQVHGGTTTNLADHGDRQTAVKDHARTFEDLRGRAFTGHNKPMHFVGTMRPEAARSRARRRVLPNMFARSAEAEGPPTERQPIPRDLGLAFVESYWNSLAWQEATWLGRPVGKAPPDLFAYQELVARLRPDWIIETVTGDGGRALFLASICDLIDHGKVVSVDEVVAEGRPEHPRVTYVVGPAETEATAEEVRAIVGPQPHALLILGSRGRSGRTFADFRLYESLVPPGSYVVFEDTIVNGHPVWADHGPGPFEAVKGVLGTRDDFAADRSMDRHVPSFNPGGYLKRIR
jgi:cephalosporin hydroxylase